MTRLLRVEITVKVKANMQFKKIFDVAEVIRVLLYPRKPHALIVRFFQKRFGKDSGALPTTFVKHKSHADVDACRITQIRV